MTSRYRDALRVPEFRAIFVAHVVSMAGVVTANFALAVLVYSRTGSSLLSALVFALVLAPHLIGGTLLSAVVDRLPARRLLVTCNLLSAALVLVLSLGRLPVAAVLLLAFTLGLVEPVFAGTRAAVLPQVLLGSSYVAGRSLLRLVVQGAQLGGYAVGGLLLTTLSPTSMLRINAGCFLLSAVILRLATRERTPDPAAIKRTSLIQDSLAGIREVSRHPAVRKVLVVGWLVNTVAVMPEALALPYAAGHGAGPVGAGLLLTAIPVGVLGGEVLVNWLVPAERQVRFIGALAALVCVPLLGFLASPGLPVAFALLLISGLGAAVSLGQDRLLLDVVPDELRGRTLSLQMAGSMFWQGLGFAVAGTVALAVPPHVVIVASGLLGLVGATLLIGFGAPYVRFAVISEEPIDS